MTPEQLAAKFLAAPGIVTDEKVRAMRRIVIKVEANSKRVTPVKTGTLRRSISHKVESSGNVGRVGTNVHYAPYVHEGTRRMAARPFLRQGLDATRPEISGILNDMGKNIVKRIAG